MLRNEAAKHLPVNGLRLLHEHFKCFKACQSIVIVLCAELRFASSSAMDGAHTKAQAATTANYALSYACGSCNKAVVVSVTTAWLRGG